MAKITAPKPVYRQTSGESDMVFTNQHQGAIYAFLAILETEFNNLVGGDEDPTGSPLSYIDYLIIKLRLEQNFKAAGRYAKIHVPSPHLNTFIGRLELETRWRWANGQVTPPDSWLIKAGMLTLPDTRGLFERGYSDIKTTDPDGYNRPLGTRQEDAFEKHYHRLNFALVHHYGRPLYDGHQQRLVANWGVGPNTTNPINGRTSSETRPKNATVLILIRV